MSKRTVYQFPISHYCEKTRWNLDAKGLDYQTRNLIPGIHAIVTKRLVGRRTVPVLVDGPTAISDSTAIAIYLDRTYPSTPLIPAGDPERARVLELEELFDKQAGESIRQWIYGKLMATPGAAAGALFRAYPLPVRVLGKVAAPFLERELRKMYKIYPDRIASAEESILKVADRIEEETGKDPSRYLVGDSLTIADITAASTLAPLVTPPNSPYAQAMASMPESIQVLSRAFRERPAGQWVLERYKRDRKRAIA
jgi:glutathione S-transferase